MVSDDPQPPRREPRAALRCRLAPARTGASARRASTGTLPCAAAGRRRNPATSELTMKDSSGFPRRSGARGFSIYASIGRRFNNATPELIPIPDVYYLPALKVEVDFEHSTLI